MALINSVRCAFNACGSWNEICFYCAGAAERKVTRQRFLELSDSPCSSLPPMLAMWKCMRPLVRAVQSWLDKFSYDACFPMQHVIKGTCVKWTRYHMDLFQQDVVTFHEDGYRVMSLGWWGHGWRNLSLHVDGMVTLPWTHCTEWRFASYSR